MWDGSSWTALGAGLDGSVIALAASGSNVYAGLSFTPPRGPPPYNGPPPLPVYSIYQWDGNTWTQLGTVGDNIDYPALSSLAVAGGNLYVSGIFSEVGGVPAANVAKWDGTSWTGLGSGTQGNGGVYALAVFGKDLFAGGQITTAGGVPANNIARWDGTSWTPLGSGTGGYFGWVDALTVFGSDLYAGGVFTTAGAKVSGYVARASLVSASPPPAVTSFSAVPVSGRTPLKVQFTGESTNSVTGWNWNFGDGSASSPAQNPSHTYTNAGDYTVTLTVTGSGGSSSNSLPVHVTAQTPQQQIAALAGGVIAVFRQRALNRGQEITLLARLREAENSISKGQDATACDEVGVFIKLVQAEVKRGALTQTEGQSLIEAAYNLRVALGCQ